MQKTHKYSIIIKVNLGGIKKLKKYSKKIIGFALIFIMLLTLTACGSYARYHYNLVGAFQTESQVVFWEKKVFHPKSAYDKVIQKLNDELTSLDNKFNIQDRGDGIITDLMEVNNNAGIAPVVVDKEVIDVIKLAIEVAEETIVDEVVLYDVTIAPIWKLWDFPGKTYSQALTYEAPAEEQIQGLLDLVNYKDIEINEEESTVYLKNQGMGIDLGSIVKGYAADKLKNILVEEGIKKGYVDIGRNILLIGSGMDNDTKDAPFPVRVATPYISVLNPKYEELSSFCELKLIDVTVVTSGTYEKYFKDAKGNEYHHLIDPRTGYPFANNVVSVSVITKESIKGDAYSTALFSLGLEKGMELVNSKADLDAVWVIKNNENYEVYISEGLVDKFELIESVKELNFVYKGVYK